MRQLSGIVAVLPRGRALAGLLLVLLGECMIVYRDRPWTDFYFPIVWLGYVLLLDGSIERVTGVSLLRHNRRLFLVMLPVSATFWWLFELLNLAVRNWSYLGASMYTGVGYVGFGTACFAFVLLAVWLTADSLHLLVPPRPSRRRTGSPPTWLLGCMMVFGALCLVLPLLLPRFAFGLIWGSMYLLLDPINYWMGRPSMIGACFGGRWRMPLCFAVGALVCGFFWEGWNFWAVPKWVYSIPYVDHWHVFEMPLLGWIGYLPFGLELFAMTNFVLPLLGFQPLTLERVSVPGARAEAAAAPSSAGLPTMPV